MKQTKAFATRAVHAGERQQNGAINPVVRPIHPSVGYTFAESNDLDAVLGGEKVGYVYSTRYENPTIRAFELAIADLEGAEDAFAFSSGMAAIHIALLASGVRAGSEVVVSADIYGATYTLLQEIFTELGATIHLINIENLEQAQQTISSVKPTVLLVETISNPLLKVANLPRLASMASAVGATFLVDNTFCSPYLCNPLRWGADMVIHSATKFLSGHGDVMAGVVATSKRHRDELLRLNKLIGSSMGPFEAWLAHRGLKTLPLRMRRQCDNALILAQWLDTHPHIERVNYAFLPSHPQFDLMQTLSDGKGAGAVLSFELKDGGRDDVFAFMDALQLVQPATTLGDIYSLVLYPAISSHRSLSSAERHAIGIKDNLVRLSVGIEDSADIQADLEHTLTQIHARSC